MAGEAVVLAMLAVAVQVVLFKLMRMQFHLLQQSALQLVQAVMDPLVFMELMDNLLTSNLQQMV